MRGMRFVAGGVVVAWACGAAWGGHTKNILLTGYWPPTNDMLRQWSPDPASNPGGWQGENWEGRGYNIVSYFPEFPNGLGQGVGDFEVDYQDTSADWERVVADVKPAAIITFSRANTSIGWEFEGGNRMYAEGSWTNDYTTPRQPGSNLPIMQALSPGTELFSTLPIDEMISAVEASGANVDPFATEIDNGRFLSNYIGLHGNWYHSMNNTPDAEYQNFAAGHIHVGRFMDNADAVLATEVTLRTLTDYLDRVIPEPGALSPFAKRAGPEDLVGSGVSSVPSPGGVALLSLAGVVASRRRR